MNFRTEERFPHEQWLKCWLENQSNNQYHVEQHATQVVDYLRLSEGKSFTVTNYKLAKQTYKKFKFKYKKQSININKQIPPEEQVIQLKSEIQIDNQILQDTFEEMITLDDQNKAINIENNSLNLDNGNLKGQIIQKDNTIANLQVDGQNKDQVIRQLQLQNETKCRMCVNVTMDCANLPCYCLYFCISCFDRNYPGACPGCTVQMTGRQVIRIR